MKTSLKQAQKRIKEVPLIKYRNFQSIPLEIRKEAITSHLLKQEMIEKLPKNIAKVFVDCFLFPSEEKFKVLKDFFSLPSTSIVTTHIINHKPSSHKALEPLYNKNPIRLVDKYFYDSPAGNAIPDRLEAVVKNLPIWIRTIGKNKKRVKILIPGSGPGQDIIRLVKENPDLKKVIEAVCVDNEPSAIELGKKLAEEAGVSENITYQEGDLMKLAFQDFDIILLVGIICPLKKLTCINLLCQVKSYARKGGLVIVSAALQKMLIEDPVVCYVMHFIGWKLDYKTKDEFLEIINRAGLKYLSSFQDPVSRFHRIIIGEVL